MLSSTAEYALRAVVFLAAKEDRGQTAQQVAAGTKVPRGYVAKIMRDMARAGILAAQRGPNGGFRLVRTPDKISVLEVVNSVDPVRRITKCPLGLPGHAHSLCRLHQTLDNAIALVEKSFADTSVADMLEGTGRHQARCSFPPLTINGKSQAPDKPSAKAGNKTATKATARARESKAAPSKPSGGR